MNGSGKSSFMKVLTGLDEEYDGEVTYAKDIKVGYLAQEPMLDNTKTVRENILDGVSDKMEVLSEFFLVKEEVKAAEKDGKQASPELLTKLAKLDAEVHFLHFTFDSIQLCSEPLSVS